MDTSPICSYELSKLSGIAPFEIPFEIQRVTLSPNSEPHFFRNFLVTNQPCIVTAREAISEWPAFRDWVTSTGDINFGFLSEKYEQVKVSVTEITDDISMKYGGMNCSTMLFHEYVQYLIKYKESGYSKSMPCLYLKDWHILLEGGRGKSIEKPYETLSIFASDWLNETSSDEDDFRFAYLGPKGSWTPLHADVYGSFSWSVNIIGRKKWHLYPPGKEKRFMTSSSQQLQYNSNNAGVEGQDFIEVMQYAGETIFVPSGWYHAVWNESDVISINHNWFNGANVCYIWHQLQYALSEVKEEIADLKECDEFSEQCQLILKANHGMDYKMFCELILKICKNRKDGLRNKENHDSNHTFHQHLLDMSILKHVLHDHMLCDADLSTELKKSLKSSLLA